MEDTSSRANIHRLLRRLTRQESFERRIERQRPTRLRMEMYRRIPAIRHQDRVAGGCLARLSIHDIGQHQPANAAASLCLDRCAVHDRANTDRSEEHTSELQSLM